MGPLWTSRRAGAAAVLAADLMTHDLTPSALIGAPVQRHCQPAQRARDWTARPVAMPGMEALLAVDVRLGVEADSCARAGDFRPRRWDRPRATALVDLPWRCSNASCSRRAALPAPADHLVPPRPTWRMRRTPATPGPSRAEAAIRSLGSGAQECTQNLRYIPTQPRRRYWPASAKCPALSNIAPITVRVDDRAGLARTRNPHGRRRRRPAGGTPREVDGRR